MPPASLSLLKGNKSAAPQAEAAAEPKKSNIQVAKKAANPPVIKPAEPEPAPVEQAAAEEINIDKMTSKQLDQLVKENEVETPAEWAKFTVAQKRKWLNEQYSVGDDGEEVEEAEVAETATGGGLAFVCN